MRDGVAAGPSLRGCYWSLYKEFMGHGLGQTVSYAVGHIRSGVGYQADLSIQFVDFLWENFALAFLT